MARAARVRGAAMRAGPGEGPRVSPWYFTSYASWLFYLTPSACSAVPPAPLALARGFALYDEGTTTQPQAHTDTHAHTMRCELQSVVPNAAALLQAAPCQCQCSSRSRVSGTRVSRQMQ